jgi:translation initiation factor IF-3
VLLIGEKGEKLGVMPTSEALRIARDQNADLVEVAPTAHPPVCRILDYGKYKYEQAKKRKEARKGQRESILREIKMRPKIDEHDMQLKARLVKRLLDEGDKIKVSVIFRGREITHPELGKNLLQKMTSFLGDSVGVERPMAMEGRNMTIIYTPAKPPRASGGAKEG